MAKKLSMVLTIFNGTFWGEKRRLLVVDVSIDKLRHNGYFIKMEVLNDS